MGLSKRRLFGDSTPTGRGFPQKTRRYGGKIVGNPGQFPSPQTILITMLAAILLFAIAILYGQ